MKIFFTASIACLRGLAPLALLGACAAVGGEIKVLDRAEGGDYMSGAPAALPAAALSTNLFGEGACPIRNRKHSVRAAPFNTAGALSIAEAGTPAPFPEYLKSQPYVWFLQDVRHYTNYACTVSVAEPVTFYLLVDNRVNDFKELSSLDDPSFGPPDTEWIPNDGWQRVNTGISPKAGAVARPDYLQIYEGGINEDAIPAVHQFYAIYSRTFTNGGSVTLRTQFQGNMYCLVVATNAASGSPQGAAQVKPPHKGGGG